MPVDRMQWGAEAWQFADLHIPDEPSPFQNDHGVPCIMLIHGGFWKKEYTLELMQPIANALSDAGVAAWNIEFKRWHEGDEGVWMDTLSDVLRAWGQLALLPGIDITRSMVMGHSAGGHLALLMASKAERKPWLAIAQAPITDLFGADDAKLSMMVMQSVAGLVVSRTIMKIFGDGSIPLIYLPNHQSFFCMERRTMRSQSSKARPTLE